MNKIAIRRSKWAMMTFVLLGTVIGFAAITIIYRGNPEGWCFTVIAVGALLPGILGLRDNSARVIVDDNGLIVRELGSDEIAWNRVKSARIESLAKVGNMIILDLEGGQTRRFYADSLEMSAPQILRLIRERLSSANS